MGQLQTKSTSAVCIQYLKLSSEMIFNPDNHDALITIMKFLAVFTCGHLSGELLFTQVILLPELLTIANTDDIYSKFSHYWTNALQKYQSILVGVFATIFVFVCELRDRFSWLYSCLALISIYMFTKCKMEPGVKELLKNKDLGNIRKFLVKFKQDSLIRMIMCIMTFIWLIYSLYNA